MTNNNDNHLIIIIIIVVVFLSSSDLCTKYSLIQSLKMGQVLGKLLAFSVMLLAMERELLGHVIWKLITLIGHNMSNYIKLTRYIGVIHI